MATCSVATLMSDGAGFQALADRQLVQCQAELIREWLGTAPDVPTLMSGGVDFQRLDDEQLDIVTAQLLCEINGSVP